MAPPTCILPPPLPSCMQGGQTIHAPGQHACGGVPCCRPGARGQAFGLAHLHLLEGASGTLNEKLWAAPQPTPPLMDGTDSSHRAGGAAPTLALGRTGAAGSDSGSVGCSSPPTGWPLTTEGQ
eukprot:3108367-Rhodomonas_salina.4